MKSILKFIILFLFVLVVSSFKTTETEICSILKKVPISDRHTYNPDIKLGIEIKNTIKLDKKMFQKFFAREMTDADRAYLIGKFKISEKRTGVISYSTSVECDHPIYFFSLHIIDDCKISGTKMIQFSDGHVISYDISSSFNKKFDELTITEESSSEYAIEPGVETDTITTNIYKINLKSKSLDTISRKKSFKVLKLPPQK